MAEIHEYGRRRLPIKSRPFNPFVFIENHVEFCSREKREFIGQNVIDTAIS